MLELTNFQGWESPGTWGHDKKMSGSMKNMDGYCTPEKVRSYADNEVGTREIGTPKVSKTDGRFPSPEISKSPCHIQMVQKFNEIVSPKIQKMKEDREKIFAKPDPIPPSQDRKFEVRSARVSKRARFPRDNSTEPSPRTRKVVSPRTDSPSTQNICKAGGMYEIPDDGFVNLDCTGKGKFIRIWSGLCRVTRETDAGYMHIVAPGGIIYLEKGNKYIAESIQSNTVIHEMGLSA